MRSRPLRRRTRQCSRSLASSYASRCRQLLAVCSWVEQLPHALLYVRDALRLPVEPALGVPPPLIDMPPDLSRLLDRSARVDAAREWTRWWAILVQHETRRHFVKRDPDLGATPERDVEHHRERFFEYDRAVPPETSPRSRARCCDHRPWRSFGEGCHWARAARAEVQIPQKLTSRPQTFPWVVVRDTAEAVAAAWGVDAGAVDGAASVLVVEGAWWDLVAPRFALCSVAAATDPGVAGAMLRSVFESGLAAA